MEEKGNPKKKYAATIGTILIDVGKLAVGSLIFGAVLRGSINPVQIVLFGIIFAIIFIAVGVLLVVFSKE